MNGKLSTGIRFIVRGAALALLVGLAGAMAAQQPAQDHHTAVVADAATVSPAPAVSPDDITWGN